MSVAYNARPIAIDRCVLNLDANNSKSYSNNVHPNPINIGAWATSGGAGTYSRDPTVTDSPVGGVPLKMVVTGADPYTSTYNNSTWNLAPVLVGQTWTVSVWVKSSVSTLGQLFIFGANSVGTYLEAPAVGINITPTWQRFSYTYTFANASSVYIQTRLDGPDSGFGIDGITRPTIWWDGLQVEKNSAATTFNPRTNAGGSTWTDPVRQITATNYGYVPFSTDGGGCFDFATVTGANSAGASLGFTFAANMIPTMGNYVFSTWVKNPPAGGQTGMFSNSGGGDGYRFGVNAASVYVLCGTPYAEASISYINGTMSSTVFHHIVAVFDRTGIDTGSPRVALYLDGVYQGAMGLSSPQIQSSNATPGLVRSACCGLYTGKIAIFAAYSGHMTADEVNALFNSQRSRFSV